jgi:hypothetical protein
MFRKDMEMQCGETFIWISVRLLPPPNPQNGGEIISEQSYVIRN